MKEDVLKKCDQSLPIKVKMQHFLEGCNYLIVLDDVSDQSLLSRIISALPGAAAEVVVTVLY
jgi:hypothetical protein